MPCSFAESSALFACFCARSSWMGGLLKSCMHKSNLPYSLVDHECFSPASFLLTLQHIAIAYWLLIIFLWSTCKQQVRHCLSPVEKISVSSLHAHPICDLIFFLFQWNWSDGAVARRSEQTMPCNGTQNTIWWTALNKEDLYPSSCFGTSCVWNTCSQCYLLSWR